jgi:hypothetical protein
MEYTYFRSTSLLRNSSPLGCVSELGGYDYSKYTSSRRYLGYRERYTERSDGVNIVQSRH